MIFKKISLVLALSTLTTSASFAGDYGAGNGGDICEANIVEISQDIKSWINKGGARTLTLSRGWRKFLPEMGFVSIN
ncbi:MAG: hypothetical protein ACPGJV_14770 [Bacteriovoracaceae bacterium]